MSGDPRNRCQVPVQCPTIPDGGMDGGFGWMYGGREVMFEWMDESWMGGDLGWVSGCMDGWMCLDTDG